MANTNPLLDDLAGLMTGAMGAARAAGEEVRTAAQGRVREMVADMDLVSREEVEVLRGMLVSALERIEALEARLDAVGANSPDRDGA